jgi:hypothetical protein
MVRAESFHSVCKLKAIGCAEENWNRAKRRKFAISENVID